MYTRAKISTRFSKRDRQTLTNLLERLYLNELVHYKFFHQYPDLSIKKTQVAVIDRRYRLEIKSVEVLLFKLKSPLLLEKNGKQRPNFRKTLSIDAR